jgi:hypothetical protein
MKQSEASQLLLRKAAQDEALLDAILSNVQVREQVRRVRRFVESQIGVPPP